MSLRRTPAEAPRRARRPKAVARETSLERVAAQLREPRAPRTTTSLAKVAKQLRAPGPVHADDAPLDIALPARPIRVEIIAGRAHYERVIAAVLAAHTSVWIATANVKGLMVEDGRAAPGRRKNHRRGAYVSVLSLLDGLAERGVELRLLHAELPSRPFREELVAHPKLAAGGLALARCPRVHLKAVIVDGSLLYLGSANWTGAGLGAKGSGRRNFELGIVTDDAPLLDQVQGMFERIWSGGECGGCKLRELCPGPLDGNRG
ncbi:hypothetical protein BH11MYX3_BH11MYX3_26950 [soil metagenome]